GGLGADQLDGGAGDDILIGGMTSHDANTTALLAIMQEWGRIDQTYQQRVDHISGTTTGGLNGTYLLNSTTVLDDNKTPDSLFGRGGTDWFCVASKDQADDTVNGEVRR